MSAFGAVQPKAVSCALVHGAGIDPDLESDGLQGLVEVGDLLLDSGLVPLQNLKALRLVASALASELRIVFDLWEGHAGGPQLGAHLQPSHLLLGEYPAPGGITFYGR